MVTDVLDRMVRDGEAQSVTAERVDRWLSAHGGLSVLLFSGASQSRPESHDVAVVLRDFMRRYGTALRAGIVSAADESSLAPRFSVLVFPSLVFLAGDMPVETIARMRDWSDYDAAFRRYLGDPSDAAARV